MNHAVNRDDMQDALTAIKRVIPYDCTIAVAVAPLADEWAKVYFATTIRPEDLGKLLEIWLSHYQNESQAKNESNTNN